MLRLLPYVAVLALFPLDAHAWGLPTHLFFAHYALLALPLADPALRAAAARFPRLVLAGACLPDLALIGQMMGTPAFQRSHRWSMLRRIAAAPRDDRERALAFGYGTHLVVDVIAHNIFVPEHEARLLRGGQIAHAISEWAMDEHLKAHVPDAPAELLAAADPSLLAGFVARAFRCDETLAAHGLGVLRRANGLLAASRLPRVCRSIVGLYERRLEPRFDSYVRRTKRALRSVEPALAGRFVDWESSDPEGETRKRGADRGTREHVARVVEPEHHA
jgi:hypothetical protein